MVSIEGVRYERNNATIEWNKDACTSTAYCVDKYPVGPGAVILCMADHRFNDQAIIDAANSDTLLGVPECVGFYDGI